VPVAIILQLHKTNGLDNLLNQLVLIAIGGFKHRIDRRLRRKRRQRDRRRRREV